MTAASTAWSMSQAATKRSSILEISQLWGLLLHAHSVKGATHPPLKAWCLCSKARISVGVAVENWDIVFVFLLSLFFCLLSGKAALGAEEAAAMENVHSHAEHSEANRWQVPL